MTGVRRTYLVLAAAALIAVMLFVAIMVFGGNEPRGFKCMEFITQATLPATCSATP